MDESLLKILETINNLKKDIEDVISEQKLSAKYRFHIEYYFGLCDDVEQRIHELAETKKLMSLERLNRFKTTHLDILLQLHSYLMMKAQYRSENIAKKESAFEFLADDVFIKMKCYGYNILIIITDQSNSIPSMRIVPFALEKIENFKAVIILINKQIVNDIKKWNIIGHEIGHIIPESRIGNDDQKEFYADFFATIVFGTSYLYSMIDRAKNSSLMIPYMAHPPWIYRINGIIDILKTFPKKISKKSSTIYKNWSDDLVSSFEALTRTTNLDELNPELRIEIERSYSQAIRLIEKYQKDKNLATLNLSDSIINLMKVFSKKSSSIQKLSPTEIIQLYCLGQSTNIFKLPYKFTIKTIYQWGINQM